MSIAERQVSPQNREIFDPTNSSRGHCALIWPHGFRGFGFRVFNTDSGNSTVGVIQTR
jgi:hypothetical protein